MRELTEKEKKDIIRKAEMVRDNAPQLSPEDARRLSKKWNKDSESYTTDMIKEK